MRRAFVFVLYLPDPKLTVNLKRITTGRMHEDAVTSAMNEAEVGWITYRLFGINMRSNFPLMKRVAVRGTGPADLSFVRTHVSEPAVLEAPPLYVSPFSTRAHEPVLYIYRAQDHLLFRFSGVGDFILDGDRIVCHQLDGATDHSVELWLVGTVLAYWLALRGMPALHASAIEVDGQALAFIANSTAGKSALATTFLKHGHPLITDDVLALRVSDDTTIAYPSYPRLRLWPNLADHFLGSSEELDLVHPDHSKRLVSVGPDGFGRFCEEQRDLGCIYVPSRSETLTHPDEITFETLPPREATIALVGFSFLSRILAATGLEGRLLPKVGAIARTVPVRRFSYPSGLDLLDEVRNRLLDDFRAVRMASLRS